MSWGSIIATSVAVDEAAEKLAAAVTAYQTQLEAADYDLDAAAKEQIEAASAAVNAVIASGAVGTGLVNVSLNGHANPEHKPVKGWANDSITITVSCADPQPAAS
jgi:hypothetical protein